MHKGLNEDQEDFWNAWLLNLYKAFVVGAQLVTEYWLVLIVLLGFWQFIANN